jgi:hypothetical protein
MKKYANWNACNSCGFDIKDGHMLATCLAQWCKATHNNAFTCENAQGYLSQGYDLCNKGMHKMVIPGGKMF